MEQLGNVLKEAERYLLDIHCILMDPEYIFYEEGRYYFCYYPLAKQDIWEKFHIIDGVYGKSCGLSGRRMCPSGIFIA